MVICCSNSPRPPSYHHYSHTHRPISPSFVIVTDGVMDPPKSIPLIPIQDLGIHPLEEIFSFLDPPDLARLEQVCKSMKQYTQRQWHLWCHQFMPETNLYRNDSRSNNDNTINDNNDNDLTSLLNLSPSASITASSLPRISNPTIARPITSPPSLSSTVSNNLRTQEALLPWTQAQQVARYWQARAYTRRMEFWASCTFDYDTTSTLRNTWLSSRYALPSLDVRAWKPTSNLWSIFNADFNDKSCTSTVFQCNYHHPYRPIHNNDLPLSLSTLQGHFSVFVRLSRHVLQPSLEDCSDHGEDTYDEQVWWQGYVPYRLISYAQSSAALHLDLPPLPPDATLSSHAFPFSVTVVLQEHHHHHRCSLLCATAGLGMSSAAALPGGNTIMVPMGNPQQQSLSSPSTPQQQRHSRRSSWSRWRRRRWSPADPVVVVGWRRRLGPRMLHNSDEATTTTDDATHRSSSSEQPWSVLSLSCSNL
jgi:hypothetical protein